MVWTYSGDPSSNERDRIRFLVGDTDADDGLVDDEEIEFLLDESGEGANIYWVAALVCEVIASKFAREINHSAEGLSWSGSSLYQQFQDRAAALRALAARTKGRGKLTPYVGGISWAERRKADRDSDKIKTHFRSHQHDHPETVQDGTYHDPLRPGQP